MTKNKGPVSCVFKIFSRGTLLKKNTWYMEFLKHLVFYVGNPTLTTGTCAVTPQVASDTSCTQMCSFLKNLRSFTINYLFIIKKYER
jgi:hypothetical protein